jgi:hypothetical protein
MPDSSQAFHSAPSIHPVPSTIQHWPTHPSSSSQHPGLGRSSYLEGEIEHRPSVFSPLLRADRGQRLDKAEEVSRKNLHAQEVGRQKKLARELWHSKHGRNTLPPIRLMSISELRQIGIKSGSTRFHATDYLEEKKMRKDNVDWLEEDIPKPSVHRHLPPLKGHSELEDRMLIRKQEELDALLDDDGLLTTSSAEKMINSELFQAQQRKKRSRRSHS